MTEDLTRDDAFRPSVVVFRVQDHLFTVDRKPFETDSDVFQGMFSLPAGDPDNVIEGSDDEHPIHLDGIAAEDFRAFLKAMYAPLHRGMVQLSKEEWMSALNLAHKWSFVGIKHLAATELLTKDFDPVLGIEMARGDLDIAEWFGPAVAALTNRRTPLTDEEVLRIDFPYAFEISRAREMKMETHVTEHLTRRDRCETGHIIGHDIFRCRKETYGRSFNRCGDSLLRTSKDCIFCSGV